MSKVQKINPSQSPTLCRHEKDETEPYWLELLRETTVSSILKPRKLVKAHYSEEIGSLLKKLATERILAAVVMDEDSSLCYGFVDVLDLMFYVLDVSSWSSNISVESLNIKWEAQCFSRQNSGTLTNYSQRNPFKTVSPSTSLLEVARLFAEGIHRVGVLNSNGNIENILSQSDLVRFLTERGVWIGSKLQKALYESGVYSSNVTCITQSATAIEAFKLMKEKGFSGLPIVDDHQRMVANLSATDLVGLNESNFHLVKLPVLQFLKGISGFPKPPVCVKPEDTVETLMLKFVVHKVHRLYIVDPSMKPTGVITLTDLIKFFL